MHAYIAAEGTLIGFGRCKSKLSLRPGQLRWVAWTAKHTHVRQDDMWIIANAMIQAMTRATVLLQLKATKESKMRKITTYGY